MRVWRMVLNCRSLRWISSPPLGWSRTIHPGHWPGRQCGMEGNAMSGDELRLTTADLGDLAAKQDRAAHGILSAVNLTKGTDAAVRNTHGPIASASADALVAVLAARRNAGSRMAAI